MGIIQNDDGLVIQIANEFTVVRIAVGWCAKSS